MAKPDATADALFDRSLTLSSEAAHDSIVGIKKLHELSSNVQNDWPTPRTVVAVEIPFVSLLLGNLLINGMKQGELGI